MAQSLSDITIVVVEDQRSIRGLLVNTLNKLGVGKVIGTTDARSAMQIVKDSYIIGSQTGTGSVNAVLVDIVLENEHMSGLDFAEWIRENPDSPNKFMPIMMFSALASIKMVQRSRDLGVNVFMRKPFAVENLSTLLLGLIRDQRNFIKAGGYFGPDRRRATRANETHDPERRRPIAQASKDIKVFRRSKSSTGSYSLSDENFAKAEKVFTDTTEAAVKDLDNRVKKVIDVQKMLSQSVKKVQNLAKNRDNNGEEYAKLLISLSKEVLDNMVLVRLNMGVFRVPVLSEISRQLCEFVCRIAEDPLKTINNDSVSIIEKFVQFMTVIIRERQKMSEDVNAKVIEELRLACGRFTKKYIPNPLDDAEVDKKIRAAMTRIKSSGKFDDFD